MGESGISFPDDRPSPIKSIRDGYLESRLEEELKKDLTLSTIDLLLFGR